MGRYIIGIVMIIAGIVLLMITQDRDFKEVEESIVIAYSFLIFGIIYIVYKLIRKRNQ
ncbi:hypothetical protein SAMN05880501_11763 [Ureibacillus xyleni]|uniref:Uncharacterized protein n=1 Tax=Ureibacillus xyleni TaxID=614648 RepID=A0A285TQK8_9BACL|nr:hypothetical protein [Ureibacillus xyleni]SOC24598.1 hypothetical protein SAMN05880501_11763 [Ureibacillus xyleni]